MRTPSVYSRDDPFSAALKPSPTETEAERLARQMMEAEAKRRSEQIDEDIRQERERLKRNKDDVKLLLLGQAESGKSTLQKQFQLMYKPHSLEDERISWKTVIYFNVVHSLKHILSTLEGWEESNDEEQDGSDAASLSGQKSRKNGIPFQSSASLTLLQSPGLPNGSTSPSTASVSTVCANTLSGTNTLSLLRKRLTALMATDAPLADRLSGGISVSGSGKGAVYVRTGWQDRTIENAFTRLRPKHEEYRKQEEIVQDILVEDVGRLLGACVGDIQELWEHSVVKNLIARRKLKLDEWSEYFLQHISRVATPSYVPSTEDILHARIQTMGVSEHVFDVSIHGKNVAWHLYDVGGARGQRHSWVPYFDDANAIIFVAPVSAFDQYLEEDPRTNRIDDSLQLFTQICSNALLKNVHLVLFLNKTDLLKAKLESGLKVRKYITSFGERSNDYDTVVQYFRAHFLQVHRRNNENRRVLYTHFTSVVDTKATQRIIGNVRDAIFRGYLQSAALV